MSLPVWCADLAARFWAGAGGPPPFPRNLFRVAGSALHVASLKGVNVAGVRSWFARNDIRVPLDEPDRRLRACLVAWRGEAFAFVDALDWPDEQNFSLAHELGHFLRDYRRPREVAAARLGSAALAVLDGDRPPTAAERAAAVLRGVPLGAFAHLLRRDDDGRPLSPAERAAEDAADRLAFELLAPAAALGEPADRVALTDRLATEFGLPPGPAARYAALLRPDPPKVDRAVARLLRR